jgi:hypothetical protein
MSLKRLSDTTLNNLRLGRYLIEIKPRRKLEGVNMWTEQGLRVGLIDTNPNGVIGEIRLVAIHKEASKQLE